MFEEQSIINRIAKYVQSFLLTRREDDIEGENYLKNCFSKERCPEINYNRYAESFAYLYFLENFFKAVSVFLQEPPPLAKRIIDAGCGSAAGALAYLAVLDQSLCDARWRIEVVLIDRSEAQLHLAEKLLKLVEGEFQHLDIVPCFQEPIDLRYWEPDENSADCLLYEHVLTENLSDVGVLLGKALLSVAGNGKIYIIERTEQDDGTVWQTIEQAVPQFALPATYGDSKLASSFIDLLPSPQLAHKISRYLILHIPERKQLVELLRLYFCAWETQSEELLENIFAQHAQYHEKVYESSFQGLEEIKAYWRANVLEQRDIRVRILRTAYAVNDAFAEWEAEFVKAQYRVQVRGALILRVDLAIDRVISLHEYYRSHWE
jgi:SnoaL-like domain